jgi:hypothetical protein
MDSDQLSKILELHNDWLEGKFYGVKADLSNAVLSGANLSSVNLRGAVLRGANLMDANLRGADLVGADLRDAYLNGADLSGADLRDAVLRGANLGGANLWYTDLKSANLKCVNFEQANFDQVKLPEFQIPQEGSLIVWKKLRDGCIAKLEIPDNSKRTASLVGRKCRAEFAKVIEIYNYSGVKLDTGTSCYDSTIKYDIGEIIYPDRYNPDIRVECTHGIHFFLTREEAEAYTT